MMYVLRFGRNEYRNGEKALKLSFWRLLFEGKVVYLIHNYNGRLHSWAKVFFFFLFFFNILSCLRGQSIGYIFRLATFRQLFLLIKKKFYVFFRHFF